ELCYTSPVWDVYREVDIVLDCFPHNSGTTTYEALWMGAPVVTLADRPSVGRLGASILSCIGKPEWIAGSVDDYVERAVSLAQDTSLLARECASLRQTMLASPLLDQDGFARDMETAYRNMWNAWCNVPSPAGTLSIGLAFEHHRAGRLAEAEHIYRELIKQDPANVDALHSLGLVYHQRGDHTTAEFIIRKALDLMPAFATAHNNLGFVLEASGKRDEAIEAYRHAIQARPDYIDAYLNLGNALHNNGRLEEAAEVFRHAVELRPDYAKAHNNLGFVLQKLGRLEEAAASCQRAIAIQPDYVGAYNNLGEIFQKQGRLGDSIDCYRKALDIDPSAGQIQSNLFFCLNYHPTLPASEIFAAYRQWNEQHAARFSAHLPPFANSPDPQRRLRIGYVSPDFREHSVMHFAGALIEGHDKARFEVFCYYNHYLHDACTERVIAAADHWIPCLAISDEALAQRIRDDRIDILIDLAGHTAGNRLLVFARKPAPVQASWLGFGYTTGLTAIDYLIGDDVFTPTGCESLFSESIWRLPHAAWAYRPPQDAPEPGELPARRNGHITFACLSRTDRINSRTVEAWARILQRMPTARLRLDSRNLGDPGVRARIEAQFAALGIPASQLQMGFTSPAWEVYRNVDIVLDCFPHNSGTTTYEALWMGVPVVTLADRPSVGRLGASILSCIDRKQWIATDVDDYVNRAIALAENADRLARERAGLRQAMLASPLLDQAAFVHDMEEAYRAMWYKWCESEIKKREFA
ncbi:tetratricopeptide repeat protein, partial [Noviherbaspirillum sp. ST9]|uniref:O-linked N-acetylglucosamine transferase, SPINDLY family protein n=1 Tax=Noviherbaspirillum sp. ST9 TaxID=3401606 RepID=UPI003B58676A